MYLSKGEHNITMNITSKFHDIWEFSRYPDTYQSIGQTEILTYWWYTKKGQKISIKIVGSDFCDLPSGPETFCQTDLFQNIINSEPLDFYNLNH